MKKKKRNWKTVEWKTAYCGTGQKCWCRTIIADTGKVVVDSGCLSKGLAQLMVKEHNMLLKLNKN